MNVKDEIEAYAAEEDKPALRWLCKIASVAAVTYMVCTLIADWVTI